jgi:chitinase
MYLLNDPDQVVKDGYVAFASAMWFYMTPQSPKPSMHDVVTVFFEPSPGDINAGIARVDGKNAFGITTNIINGGLECGKGVESYGSQHRADYYKEWLDHLGVAEEEDGLGCGGMQSQFPSNSGGKTHGFFDMD